MEGAGRDVPACMSFPWKHQPRLYPTNRIERLNGEIKRCSNVRGIPPGDEAR